MNPSTKYTAGDFLRNLNRFISVDKDDKYSKENNPMKKLNRLN